MTLQHIKYFITTAECGSFTQAADQLFISQPSLSHQIIAMEKELNVLLFIRHRNHTIELTPAGQLLLERFRSIYDTYSSAVEESQRLAYNITGDIRVGILYGAYTGDFMPMVFDAFQRKYPDVHIVLENFSFGDLIKKLYTQELDVIFTLKFQIWDRDTVESETLFHSKDCLVMTKTHPLAKKLAGDAVLKMSDLNNVRFIVDSREDCAVSADLIINEFRNRGASPDFVYAPNINTLELWVESGYGITVADSRNTLRFHPGILFREFNSSWDPSLTAVWHRDNKNLIIPLFLNEVKQSVGMLASESKTDEK